MNREEAAYIIKIGKEAIEKIDNISGCMGLVLIRWFDNWDFIEAFADGKIIGFNGRPTPSPDFDCSREYYEILETQINWKKVVENGGLHVRLNLNIGVGYTLAGVSTRGNPIVQLGDSDDIFERAATVSFHDEVETKPEWYDLAECE